MNIIYSLGAKTLQKYSSMNLIYSFPVFLLCSSILVITPVEPHGRLMDPPARNSMWRFGYSNPVNYNDNELYCGGYSDKMETGKCGICGDSYRDPLPRKHEAGGEYAKGIVVRRYSVGQSVDIEVELTANHLGTFEFRLCPVTDEDKEVTQECLDKHPLKIVDEWGNLKDDYKVEDNQTIFKFKLKLMPYMSCSRCVLQWTYIAANTWGHCANGTEAVGCGPQETFVNCADVSISSNTGAMPPRATLFHPNQLHYSVLSNSGEPRLVPLVVRSQVCFGTGFYRNARHDDWCRRNCLKYPPNCPEDKCRCLIGCSPVYPFSEQKGATTFCNEKCFVNGASECTSDKCLCY